MIQSQVQEELEAGCWQSLEPASNWGITQHVIRVSKNIAFHSLSNSPGAKPGSPATEQTPLLDFKAEELNLSSDNCARLTGGQRTRKSVHKWMGEVESPEGKKCFRDEPRRSDDNWLETSARAPGQPGSLRSAGKTELLHMQTQELTYSVGVF